MSTESKFDLEMKRVRAVAAAASGSASPDLFAVRLDWKPAEGNVAASWTAQVRSGAVTMQFDPTASGPTACDALAALSQSIMDFVVKKQADASAAHSDSVATVTAVSAVF